MRMRFKYLLIVWAVFGLICTVAFAYGSCQSVCEIELSANLQACRGYPDGRMTDTCVHDAYARYDGCIAACY